jgi:hypothetical protein
LSRLSTSFVIGYHGCDEKVAHDLLSGQVDILQSDKDYDWLGPGAYFWESDPERALEFAKEQVKRGKYVHPTVIGAVIDMRNCLNLASRQGTEELAVAHGSLIKLSKKLGQPLPKNMAPRGTNETDRLYRYLDCAVIRHLHAMIEAQSGGGAQIEAYDTVRGVFTEGERAYPGAKLYKKTHVQIAVRNMTCIVGFFRPRFAF